MNEGRGKFRNFSVICACVALGLGILTFIGWISGIGLLASVRSKYIPMAPSTALCFSLLGIAIVVHCTQPRRRRLVRLLSLAVLAIACAKLVEFAGGFRFGIDEWFVRTPRMFGTVPTGRMSPITATNFVLTGIGLIALTSRPWQRWAGTFAGMAMVISAIVLVGYWYGTPLLYGGRIIPVALPTACAFFLCGTAIVTATSVGTWPLRMFFGESTRALLLRVFVPIIVAAALIGGWANTVILRNSRANPALIAALCAVVFAALIGWIISQLSIVIGGRIDRAEAARNQAQAALMALNADLENRVQARTRELREKNQQMAEELRMARELQFALLPQEFPAVPPNVADDERALRFLSLYFPTGQVSGDFFSVFPVGEKAAGVFICDVMGHGVRSALITSMIRALVEEHARVTTDPGELLTRVNHALTLILKQAGTTMFVTCFYLVADVQSAQLRFANAGHPSALHIRNGAAAAVKLQGNGRPGPAMGINPSASYVTSDRPMTAGDLVMLFTDGLFEVESASGAIFSQEQLCEAVNRHLALQPEQFFARVLDDVRKFSERDGFEDDVCVVGVEVKRTDDPVGSSPFESC
jgi:serine phosphatase RsbU (regulator of sigma subunit)